MSDSAILASQKAQVRRCWICHKSSADGFAISYCKNCQIISYCVRTGAKFWTVPHGLTLKCFFVYYQGTECQRADWKNHKVTCRKTVQHRAILKGIGSTLETDKFVEWYLVHRETVYWAIYHGKLYGDIRTRPPFNEVINRRARYQSSPRKHLEAGSSHRSTRSHAGPLQ
jgi:hypothetical protein